MANIIKEQEAILKKLNIHTLNPMQEEAIPLIEENKNIILLSPTGTGKTLAFLLPIINDLNNYNEEVQALILFLLGNWPFRLNRSFVKWAQALRSMPFMGEDLFLRIRLN